MSTTDEQIMAEVVDIADGLGTTMWVKTAAGVNLPAGSILLAQQAPTPAAPTDPRGTPFGRAATKLADDYLTLTAENAGLREQLAAVSEPAAPVDAQPLSDETLDEIADLAAHWKRHRDNGRTPASIRGALHMVIEGTAATSQPDGGPRDALTLARDMFLCCANFAALANKMNAALARQAAAPAIPNLGEPS